MALRFSTLERQRATFALLSRVPLLLVLLLSLLLAPATRAAPPTRAPFDHLTTGFELLGQHRDLPCESCHGNAIFKGTPKECPACHGVGTQIRATSKPSTHILSTDRCDACHTPVAWRPAVNFDHTQALGSCSTCHNGVQAQGKPPSHIVTDLECDACHTTLTWAGAVFTHAGVTTGCASCHDGVHADGPAANHFPISAAGVAAVPCEACHSTTEFTTFSVATMNHTAAKALPCALCHETAAFLGMHPSTNSQPGDSRPNATLDASHPKTGDCGACHDTTSFLANAVKPANHIPTTAPCAQCHTTPGNNAVYSVTGVHQGVTSCLSCHGPTVGPFANVTIVTTPGNHIPIGTLDCSGSGCHTTTNVNPGGFRLGTASISAPTLNVAGHTTVAAAVGACQTCHEAAPYLGMVVGTGTTAGDSRPTAALDSQHPTTGDCGSCHSTTPTFASNQNGSAKPANHIPTTAPCAQCHTTPGNNAVYSVTGVHQGVTSCLSCHGPTVGPFANVTIVTTPGNHIPIGALDCNGSGCHTTTNVNAGGFKLGTASISAPTLNVAGHTTVAAAVGACQTCHEAAPYLGMVVGTGTTAGDSRPTAALDSQHPTTGDCGSCHSTTPTFASNQNGTAKPANHIPTSAPCAQCHTTPGNNAVYSVTGTHQGVTGCLTCHGPTVGPFANVTIVTTPGNHMPIGALDCNGSGCHTTTNVNAGGFKLGAASINAPTLSVAGHTTVAAAVGACQTCHETAPYIGMLASTATTAGDSRPTALDKIHPTTGDCVSCHTTTPTFGTDMTAGSKPANHIPTSAPCAQCHTTAGNYALYSVTGTHQGVTGCLTCHGPTVGPFANVTIVSTPGNHIPTGSLDCNGSGCHTTGNVNPGGFKLGAASINAPVLNAAGHTTVTGVGLACATCHESAPYLGMIPSSAGAAADSRPTAFDAQHPTTGDCGNCHVTTPTFATNLLPTTQKPAGHIPTTAVCAQCHTTAGNFAVYSVVGVHQNVTNCLSCHGPTVGPFLNVTIVTTPGNHMPIGSLDCNGSGCHTTTNVNAGGFRLGAASINSPTLTVAGHTTVAAAVAGCQTCHETAPYIGMLASTAGAAGDSRPTALDKNHPTTGDCNGCHTTTPTFSTDQTGSAKPANHIPTNAPCAQCHTTPGNNTVYSVTGTHQGVTGCLTCHGPTVGPFANVTIVTTPGNHMPIGSLDCNGSGCHTTGNVNPGGFKLGAASIGSPTLTVAGHTTVAAAVAGCQTCHETAPYIGMLASTASTAGDSRPTALDKNHPTTGDCNGCHTTTPTFSTDQTGNAKPANHIPTTAACAQCHTTPGNNAVYSVTGVHQGVTSCLSCHGPTVGPFANITIVTTPGNHMPIGSLDCNRSGCHTITNVNPGGFKLGAASISSPTLTVAGHTTVAAAVAGCQTCHETAPYIGMLASTASTAGDSRPTALDKNHPTTGDCNGCHTTTPTFSTDQTGNAKPANHIPTTAACAQCHTTPGNNALYSVTGVHQGVTTCLSCHGSTVGPFANITIVTTPANHIPIGSHDCNGSGCHTTTNVNAGGFHIGAASLTTPTLTVAGHTTIASSVAGCQTCHETAPYLGMIQSTAAAAGDSRPTAFDKGHPTSGDCNGCHTTTPTFSTNQNGNSAKPANHIPTNAPCAQCHTTAGNYAVYVMGPTGHAGITNNCAQCHAYGLSFYNMAPPTLKQPPSGATGHIPAVPPNGTSAIACELCHSPTAFTTFAGTVMKHAYVTAMKCMSCHEYGMRWKTNTGVQLWVRDSPTHHAGQDCGGSGCHNPRDKLALRSPTRTTTPTTTTARSGGTVARTPTASASGTARVEPAAAAAGGATVAFSHTRVAGTACLACHNAAGGTGKPASHMTTTNACQSCHTTLAWLPVSRVDHTQVLGACVSCHNGTVASGKPSSHLPTTAACSACHTTNAWTPARFDHAAVAPHTCTVCHNAVRAIGMPRAHIPTTQQCDSCHGTLAWVPVKVDHTALTTRCASCHNNSGAVGMSPGHMVTQVDCASCHAYPDWNVIHFRHTSLAWPGQHRAAIACTTCHTANTDRIPWASGADAGTCGGCHAKDFKPGAHPKIARGALYSAHELDNCSGACHVYSDTTQSTITRSLPGPHHRVTDATFKR